MANKKDFSQMNVGGRVFHSIETATSPKGQQGSASPQEAAERKAKMKTQGRKGAKMARINMAFTPENHEFIRIMAKATGMTITQFTNMVFQKYREEHQDLYEKAKQLREQVGSFDE